MGKNDIFFGPQGALAFQRDIKDVEVHLLNTGHFPLEEDLDISVTLIKRFESTNYILILYAFILLQYTNTSSPGIQFKSSCRLDFIVYQRY